MKNIENIPEHIAIILDGNGRWARSRGLPRNLGHFQGGHNIVKIANHANDLGVKMMSIYTFSTENWKRPEDEVDYLMTKPTELLEKNLEKIKNSPIKILVQGRKDRVPSQLLKTINKIEELTKDHKGMILNVCFDYGSYDELLTAFSKVKEFTVEAVYNELMIKKPVDLLIRTSGELRISNFLLWQIAYAELYFVKKHWPAFSKRDLNKAIKSYAKRNRRFGGLKT